ncbi:hypothetical protein [Labrenzia sp. CE80]|uniref:hypothetical protein n=1 Tax=Labrenzia sp. CE80 TaxID=1788986 RepID=UPI00129BFC94|nr:hypothetical protein [Labrenzia sp. CE80]
MANPSIQEFGAKVKWLRSLATGNTGAVWLPDGFPTFGDDGDLPKALGIKPPRFGNWLTGDINPDPEAVRNIARLFGFAPTDDFLKKHTSAGGNDPWIQWWAEKWPSFRPRYANEQQPAGCEFADFQQAYKEAAEHGQLTFQEPVLPKAKQSTVVKSAASSYKGEDFGSVEALELLRDRVLTSLKTDETGKHGNYIPILEAQFSRAIAAHEHAENADDVDILAAASLQFDLVDLFGDRFEAELSSIGMPPNLRKFWEAVHRLKEGTGDKVELDGEMLRLISLALDEITKRLEEKPADSIAKALNQLKGDLEAAEVKCAIRFGILNAGIACVEKSDGNDDLRRGIRALRATIGRRPDLAPAGSIFRELDAPWCPEMVVIPACPNGFLMGSPEGEPERVDNEK